MGYLLDTDVFLTAKNLYYGMDICPGYWEWIDVQYRAGHVFSIEKVKDELMAGDDELVDWAKQRGEGFFLPPDGKLIPELGRATKWANSREFTPGAISAFMAAADLYLIAHAKAHGHTVVTLEKPAEDAKKSIKIPTACLELGVPCVDPFQLLRRERARFVLGATATSAR